MDEPPVFVATTLIVSVNSASGRTVRVGYNLPLIVSVFKLILLVFVQAEPSFALMTYALIGQLTLAESSFP